MAASSPPKPLRGTNESHTEWLLRRIWDRINRDNEHFMGVIVGQEGMGKSYTALRIANTVDPSFSADRVIFDVSELLKELKDGNHEAGNFYVLDEAGVQLGRRTWQERGQVLANQALQLIRNHNLGLIFTLPRLSELDSQAQGRLQAFYEITEKEHDEYVRGKWKFFDPDRADETGKIYKKYPRRLENGYKKRITSVSFTPPADEIVEPYEERKREFQEEFYEKTIQELNDEVEDDDEDSDDDSRDPQEVATKIANNGIEDVVSTHNQNGQPYINKNLLKVHYDLPESDADVVKDLLEHQFSTDELKELA